MFYIKLKVISKMCKIILGHMDIIIYLILTSDNQNSFIIKRLKLIIIRLEYVLYLNIGDFLCVYFKNHTSRQIIIYLSLYNCKCLGISP